MHARGGNSLWHVIQHVVGCESVCCHNADRDTFDTIQGNVCSVHTQLHNP